jgi:acetolactate synthase-1/2/3 large subunit
MMKLSDYVVEFLESNGVRNVFMLGGGGCMHLLDSIGKSRKIQYVCNHHEQACAMCVEAYAKFRNDMGVALVTSGPGATNTITGVLGAFQDSVPCLFISGQSKRRETIHNTKNINLRQLGVQEINIVPIVESITKYAVMVNNPEKIRYHLEKALYLAKSGRPGPVWLDIPLDVQSSTINEDALTGFDGNELEPSYEGIPSEDQIDEVIHSLKNASRPVIIAGHGIRLANACEELISFVSRHNLPVVTPFMGIDVIHTNHKSYIGRIGIKGTRAGNLAMQNADLIVSVGSRLSIPTIGFEYRLFAREAEVIVVDIDVEEHKKNTIRVHKMINADAKKFLEVLSRELENKKFQFPKEWLKKCNEWKRKYPVCLPQYGKSKGGINYYHFVDMLNKKLKTNTPVISDAGSSFYVVSQSVNVKKGQRYITSGALATMGFGLPAAIGVSVASGNRQVVTVTGDGSFQQNIQELQTIVHNNLPIKIFVMNNEGYLSIRSTQRRFFDGRFVGEGIQSGLSFPQTGKIARAYGIKFVKASSNKNLDKALDDVFDYNGPVICEVMTLENQEIIPTNTAKIRSDGTMVSKPLEDMYPFLDRQEFEKEMIVKPVKELP